jgi:hypothetical protein
MPGCQEFLVTETIDQQGSFESGGKNQDLEALMRRCKPVFKSKTKARGNKTRIFPNKG